MIRQICCGLAIVALAFSQTRFAILGDRTGETQGEVYADVWREIKAERPDFVLSVGDTIQGLNDASTEDEWLAVERLVTLPWWRKLYLAPGNHDIWSEASEALFEKYSKRPRHYGFDHGPVHVTVLDNSRSDQLSTGELEFLEQDLSAHANQPVKFIVSHRPSWILNAMLRNPEFPLHRLAKRYGVSYVIAGHIHQMIRAEIEGVTYISMPSAGGHLRASQKYEDGWFFGHALVIVQGGRIGFEVREVKGAVGLGRVSQASEWGLAGRR